MSSINLAVILVCGCGVGILLIGAHPAGLDPISGYLLIGLACAAFASALLNKQNKRAQWASLWIAFALLGAGRALIIHPPATAADLSYYNQPATQPEIPYMRYQIVGVISGEPLQKDRFQQLRVSAESIRLNSTEQPITIKGDMLAIVPPYPAYSFGERVTIEGTLTAPPNFSDFD